MDRIEESLPAITDKNKCKVLDISSFSMGEIECFDRLVNDCRFPVIAKAYAKEWKATQSWSPDYFKRTFGQQKVAVSTQLPTDESPYFSTEEKHRSEMSISKFVDECLQYQSCYLDQFDTSLLEEIHSDMCFNDILPSAAMYTSLWMGNKTHSGLHYDNMDNMYVQIYGVKNVYLVGPSDSGKLYPFGDNISKSKINPENPDLTKYPKFAKVKLYKACLQPGDVLFFPKGWWHHFSSLGQSISLSCWHGDSLTISDQIRGLNAAGLHLWFPVVRDFFWFGALKKPFKQRLFSAPPTGKVLFDLLFPAKL